MSKSPAPRASPVIRLTAGGVILGWRGLWAEKGRLGVEAVGVVLGLV
jgi:hypothetical protein